MVEESRIIESRWSGVRVKITIDRNKRKAEILPNEDDLAEVGDAAVLDVWERASVWAFRFLAKNPRWAVNGNKGVPRDEDEDGAE